MHSSILAVGLLFSLSLAAQTPTATIDGRVLDVSKAVVQGAAIRVIDVDTNVQYTAATNANGLFTLVNLPPGNYRVEVSKPGFRTIVKPNVILHVQDFIALNFEMSVGSILETVTVEAGAPIINTESAAVGTVVDRNFAENLPMNGRSFQSLVQLTPGVVLVPSTPTDSGQFTVNGQRAESNYWMVDGVSANVGIGVPNSTNAGNGLGGTLGAFSAFGGTNSLVSIDAMEEFRIQTSTYAPEFGRTPGGQISIVTRSGTNIVHGTAFDYLRNDALDANNWFNTFVTPHLPKPEERQNDFGGTLSGPIRKDKTFFFFSYEGLRLRLPTTTLTAVPDLPARQGGSPSIQPFLNAYPQPNGVDDPVTGVAQFNASYSNPASLDAYSLRLDHKLTQNLNLFGRYNYSPSRITTRGPDGVDSINTIASIRNNLQTATLGATWTISTTMGNDFRLNYSRNDVSSRSTLDDFGGAVPLSSLPIPGPFTTRNAFFVYCIFSLQQGCLLAGKEAQNLQRQINLVNSLYMQKGAHGLKFGIDFQRLSPGFLPPNYSQQGFFGTVSDAANGQCLFCGTTTSLSSAFHIQNLGMYAQDTWHATSRLTLTYGLRWDVDFAPSTTSGPPFAAVEHFSLSDLPMLALASVGTPPYSTTYANIAPRLGIAYQLLQRPAWGLVLRGGFGVFYDLTTSEMGNLISQANYPNGAFNSAGGSFPLTPAEAAPPPVTAPGAGQGSLIAFDPHLQQPYTLEWNVALEQALGNHQNVSLSYVGAAGRRLLQTAESAGPSPNWGFAEIVTDTATSDYHSLQLQFQRRLLHGLQALSSYVWAHSIDSASDGSYFNASNLLVPGATANANRGSSDFDIRSAFSAGLTYQIPVHARTALSSAILGDWSLQSTVQARSAPPVDLSDVNFFELNNGIVLNVRPDVVPDAPFYLFGPQYPGGKAFNPNAFTNPPSDPNTGNPARQGDLGRNVLRGFGAFQWDFAVHRDFPLRESLKLEFRAELFNILNHPNFGQPSGKFGAGGFGVSSQTLNENLNASNLGSGAFNPLYQIGGPRSIQLALKLHF